jgi:hypothetical protein
VRLVAVYRDFEVMAVLEDLLRAGDPGHSVSDDDKFPHWELFHYTSAVRSSAGERDCAKPAVEIVY